MRTLCKTDGTQTTFIIADLDPVYHRAVRALAFDETPDGFAQSYPAATPNLDRIYDNFARHAEEMVLQEAGVSPVPWEQTLEIFLHTIEGHGIDWWLVGSAALAVRGLDITPGDIDLSVSDQDAFRLGDLLLEYMIAPVKVTDGPGSMCNSFGRSFPLACLEWVGGVDERADQLFVSDFGPIAASRSENITWRGHSLRIPPLDLQLQINQRRGRIERAAKILAHLK